MTGTYNGDGTAGSFATFFTTNTSASAASVAVILNYNGSVTIHNSLNFNANTDISDLFSLDLLKNICQ